MASNSGGKTVNAENAQHCFLDLDLGHHREKLGLAAAFVDATDSRYGFSSKDLLQLGGSELARIPELMETDHEWSSKVRNGGVEIRPPAYGCRVVLKLHWDIAPLACENFATLCSNGASNTESSGKKAKPAPIGESGKPLTYRNSVVHRIIPGFVLQGGDFVFGNGSGGESIFGGKKFKDERAGLAQKHSRRGILSMGNSGKNNNSSQWFITLAAAPQCDGKHVVFGQVISGWEVLDAAEKLGSSTGEPMASVSVTDCGLWTPFATPACGYWYDQPDVESFTGVSPVFIVRPRIAVVAPSDAVLGRFSKALLPYCAVTLVRAEEAATSVQELLASFAVDAVIIAPACSNNVELQLPESWASRQVSQVVLQAKPAEALKAIRSKCWLSCWQLEGKPS